MPTRTTRTSSVICKDGTTDTTGSTTPCVNNGGVRVVAPKPAPEGAVSSRSIKKTGIIANMTTTQKVLAVVGLTAVCYFILYKAGSLK